MMHSIDKPVGSRQQGRVGGFTYLVMPGFMAIMGFILAAIGEARHIAQECEKEWEALFVGNPFRRATRSCHAHCRFPGAASWRTLEIYFNLANRVLKRVGWVFMQSPSKRPTGRYSARPL